MYKPKSLSPPAVDGPYPGRFLDAEAVQGDSSFRSFSLALDKARRLYPYCSGITAERSGLTRQIVYTLRKEGPTIDVPESTTSTWYLVRGESNNRCNETFKLFLARVNYTFSFFGFTCCAMAIYVLVANWGALDPSFFTGGGIIFFFFGAIIVGITYVGDKGIMHHRHNKKFSSCTGVRMLLVYLVFCSVALVCELYFLSVSLDAMLGLRVAYAGIVVNEASTPYSSFEAQMAIKFNSFFYGAQTSPHCPDLNYEWLWLFTNHHCPLNMNQLSCEGCNDYSATICDANMQTCIANGQLDPTNQACAYNACRAGILNYITSSYEPFSYFVTSMCFLQCIIILMTIMLLCFHPRASWTEIESRAGIRMTPTESLHRGPSREVVKIEDDPMTFTLDMLDVDADVDVEALGAPSSPATAMNLSDEKATEGKEE